MEGGFGGNERIFAGLNCFSGRRNASVRAVPIRPIRVKFCVRGSSCFSRDRKDGFVIKNALFAIKTHPFVITTGAFAGGHFAFCGFPERPARVVKRRSPRCSSVHVVAVNHFGCAE